MQLVEGQVPNGWGWCNVVQVFTEAAEGLCIWASTAVKMVRSSDDCVEKLESLLDNIRSVGGGIDNLYTTTVSAETAAQIPFP